MVYAALLGSDRWSPSPVKLQWSDWVWSVMWLLVAEPSWLSSDEFLLSYGNSSNSDFLLHASPQLFLELNSRLVACVLIEKHKFNLQFSHSRKEMIIFLSSTVFFPSTPFFSHMFCLVTEAVYDKRKEDLFLGKGRRHGLDASEDHLVSSLFLLPRGTNVSSDPC